MECDIWIMITLGAQCVCNSTCSPRDTMGVHTVRLCLDGTLCIAGALSSTSLWQAHGGALALQSSAAAHTLLHHGPAHSVPVSG